MYEDPLQQLLKLRDRMNRLFEDSMTRFAGVDDLAPVGYWQPPADVYEDAERLVIHVELPGIDRGEIDLTVEEGSLTLRGERRLEPNHRLEDYHRLERSYGPFRRAFRLPPGVDGGAVQAEMRGGILVISIPKPREGGGSRVRVQVDQD